MANRWISTVFKGVRRFIDGATGQPLVERSDVELRNLTVFDDADNNRTIITANADIGSATPDATPNTIAKRNALGNCAFVGLQATTLGVSGSETVGGTLTVTGNITSTTGALSVAQNSSFGGAISVANGITAGSAVSCTNVIMTGISSVVTTGTAISLSADSGVTPMLTLNSFTSAGTFFGAFNATSFKLTNAVAKTFKIELKGLSNSDWSYDVSTLPAFWKVSTTGATGLSTRIRFPISSMLPDGCTLTGATVMIAPSTTSHYPAGGSGGFSNMPQLQLRRYTASTNTETVIGTDTDSSGNAAAYIVPHSIEISSLTHTVTKSTDAYFADFIPESGVTSLPGTAILYIEVSYTLPIGYVVLPT